MTKFTDGPAAGTVLQLARAPLFLRVVKNAKGEIDALDQLRDSPALGEDIFVYRKVSSDGGLVHIDGYNKRGKRFGVTLAPATYSLHGEQPDTDTARNTTSWRAWAMEQAGRANG